MSANDQVAAGASDPVSQLPHRYPFLLLDRVLVMEPGHWVVALRNLSHDDPLIDAEGIFPPVLLVEMMAQAAGLAVSPGGGAAVLANVRRFRCRPPVAAGDQLVVTARVVRQFGANAKVHTCIQVSGRRRAAGELVLHFAPRCT